MRSFICNVSDNVSLLIKPCNYFYDCQNDTDAAAKRFIYTSKQLSDGDHLGWQLSFDPEGRSLVSAFSESGVGITREDYNWIFSRCAAADEAPSVSFEDICGDGRSLYALSIKRREGASDSKKAKTDCFGDIYKILKEFRAVVRIIRSAGSGGIILLGISGGLTLRMRTMFSMAFDDITIARVDPSKDLSDDCLLPDSIIASCLSGLLEVLTVECHKKEEEEKEKAEEESNPETVDTESVNDNTDETGCTPIEKLELSIRSYNCLMKAGINSVEKLRETSDDELRKLRNLGVKSFYEVKDKLARFKGLPVQAKLTAPTYLEMLNELIGLENVKEQVRKIIALAKMKQDMDSDGVGSLPIALNMEFVGNPGTAKTTVARIVAGLLSEIGLLKTNEIVEVGRADLVAKYLGQTADQVKSVFENAKGKLLFIDEAYSLLESRRGDYGDEAINTIVQEMENNRDNTVVIFAGYPDEMEKFFSRNPGLRSRVPFTVKFSDYTVEEMVEISELEAKKKGFTVSFHAKEKIADLCKNAVSRSDAGNGRFCRNLVEGAILNYAYRTYGTSDETPEKTYTLSKSDFEIPEESEEKQGNRDYFIGFSA